MVVSKQWLRYHYFRLGVLKCFIESKGVANNIIRELACPLLRIRIRYVRSVFENLGPYPFTLCCSFWCRQSTGWEWIEDEECGTVTEGWTSVWSSRL